MAIGPDPDGKRDHLGRKNEGGANPSEWHLLVPQLVGRGPQRGGHDDEADEGGQ